MGTGRTDLALETLEGRRMGPEGARRIPGLQYEARQVAGFAVTRLAVSSALAQRAVGKPRGRYTNIDLAPYLRREAGYLQRAAMCLGAELRRLMPDTAGRTVLVAGLGNRRMTADAVGPLTLEHLVVTRHMVHQRGFGGLASVAALATGVKGDTGMETLELLRGAADGVEAAAVIVVDALAAQQRERLCSTVQLSDTGLVPGSGVGNHRKAVNGETMGVPVVAVGVPTVIAAGRLGRGGEGEELFVTPRDIDAQVVEVARLIGFGINAALQRGMSVEEMRELTK